MTPETDAIYVKSIAEADISRADGVSRNPTLEDGRWGAVEVKLGAFEFDKAAASLLRLKDKLASEAPPPSFLCILTASGGIAQTRPDGITIVPLDCLG